MTQNTCGYCSKRYRVKPSKAAKSTYCSAACMGEHYKTRMTGVHNPNFRNISRECVRCGTMFVNYSKTRRYCSLACYRTSEECRTNTAHSVARAAKAVRGSRRFSLKTVSLNQRTTPRKRSQALKVRLCEVCSLPFKGNFRKLKTCSAACLRLHISKRQKGDRSHLWQGGKTSASYRMRNSIEYARWRDGVFKRDDYTCQLCKVRGGKLSAHHVKPFSTHPWLVLEPTNGVTLCWPCHASIRHREVEYERVFNEAITQAFSLTAIGAR